MENSIQRSRLLSISIPNEDRRDSRQARTDMVRSTRRDFLSSLSFGAAAFTLPRRAVNATQSAPPNIIFVLVDDMGWADAACYGSRFHDTPNIDRLASQGMRFTSAYAAAPVCSPTRASIMTGKYPARLHLTDWIPGENASGRLKAVPFEQQLALSERTIASALRAPGYRTCHIGKWHLGSEPFYPQHHGFGINIAGNNWGHPHKGYFSPYQMQNLEEGPPDEYLTDRLTDEAIRFLEKNREGPFFLNLWHYAVHEPIQARKELVAKYQAKLRSMPPASGPEFAPEHDRKNRERQSRPDYAAMLESVDSGLGRVLEKLRELKIEDRTAIIFFSDNGGLSTAGSLPTSNRPLRAGKGWLYEGGVREPLIIRWPGVTTPGRTCTIPVVSTDFYPTMLEMAGLVANPSQHMDGISLAPLLKQADAGSQREAIFWHYPHYHGSGHRPAGSVRAGDFKLIEFFEDMHVELYNLKDDLSEKNDLARSMPVKAEELRVMLHEWRRRVKASMPEANPGVQK
jgi:arylsulfatase A-like enzyme